MHQLMSHFKSGTSVEGVNAAIEVVFDGTRNPHPLAEQIETGHEDIEQILKNAAHVRKTLSGIEYGLSVKRAIKLRPLELAKDEIDAKILDQKISIGTAIRQRRPTGRLIQVGNAMEKSSRALYTKILRVQHRLDPLVRRSARLIGELTQLESAITTAMEEITFSVREIAKAQSLPTGTPSFADLIEFYANPAASQARKLAQVIKNCRENLR